MFVVLLVDECVLDISSCANVNMYLLFVVHMVRIWRQADFLGRQPSAFLYAL